MTVTISGTGGVTLPDSFVLAGESSLPQVTTASVLSATSGLSIGAVGSYAFLRQPTSVGAQYPGDIVSGSSLRYSNSERDQYSSLSGSWRCLGYSLYADRPTVWVRIS